MRKGIVQRQRIGPQIRLLRQEHGLTLDDLAGQAELSASHLSRLERSQTLPSFTVLAKIAQVLGVSIDDFVQLEQDLEKLDEQLAWQANLLALNDDAYAEILGLSIDSRRQINRAIEALSRGQLSDTAIQEEAFEILNASDISDAWSKTRQFIRKHGMTGVGLARAVIQLNAIPGPRSGVLMSHGLLAASPNVDLLTIYRELFPTLPIDPSVVHRWRAWRASDTNGYSGALKSWSTRLILHTDLFRRMTQGLNSSTTSAEAERARAAASFWGQALEAEDSFEIAVVDDDLIGGNLLLAGGAGAVVEDHSQAVQDIDQHRTGLWISSRHLVEPLARRIGDVWDALPAEAKDRSRVAAWLHEQTGD